MTDFVRYVRRSLLACAAAGLLAGCQAAPRQELSSLPPPAQDYLLISSYFMAEGGLVSRLQDGGLSGQQVYDMAISLKYGKRMLMTALLKPSRRARHNVEMAVALMVACSNQPDPSTLNGAVLSRCIPDTMAPPVPMTKGQVPPQATDPAPDRRPR